MSDAIKALEKLVPAPSSKQFLYYRPHYEIILAELTRAAGLEARARAIELMARFEIEPTFNEYSITARQHGSYHSETVGYDEAGGRVEALRMAVERVAAEALPARTEEVGS